MAFVTDAAAKEKKAKEEIESKFKTELKSKLKDSDENLQNIPRAKQRAVASAAVSRSEATKPDSSPKDESASDSALGKKTDAKPEAVKPDIDGAAKALFGDGTVRVARSLFNKQFKTSYNVTEKNIQDIQTALDKLRAAEKATKKPAVISDITDPANRPTEGGMAEDDAAKIADLNGWDVVYGEFTCTDISHSPKGRVYTNNKGAYYGADNTGHVGWGFKIWSKRDKTTLVYQGNLVWTGKEWKHITRSGAGK
jgi:hypothetical protein